MRETIYTIPLTDALVDGECPFCYLHQRTEERLLALYMEGAVMEPDWRGRLLENGLCGDHLRRLFHSSPRLGMAILTKGLVDHAGETLAARAGSRKPNPPTSGCLACSDLEEAFAHYVDGFLLTYKKEADFRERVRRANLCLPHLWGMLRQMSQKRWRDTDLEKELIGAVLPRVEVIRKDLDWFIRKFDYRFDQEPWNGAEDAVERALKLMGAEVSEE